MEMAMVLLVASVLCLPGCGKKYDSVPSPKTKINPSPQEKYLVSVYAGNGMPRKVRVQAIYHITNKKCIPLDYGRALGGVRLDYPVKVDLTPKYISENKFLVLVGIDKILPGNYWGLGLCRWDLDNISVSFNNEFLYSIRARKNEIIRRHESMWRCRLEPLEDKGMACFKQYGLGMDVKANHRKLESDKGDVFLIKSRRFDK